MRELQSGRPTLTSTPTFRSTLIIQGITFPDGTTQTSTNTTTSPWFDWTPSFTGFSVNPTVGTARYTQSNKLVSAFVNDSANGTSNATTYTITLPVNAKAAISNVGFGGGIDGGAVAGTCSISTRAGSTTADVYKDQNSGVWTNSGAKNCNFTVIYEAQ